MRSLACWGGGQISSRGAPRKIRHLPKEGPYRKLRRWVNNAGISRPVKSRVSCWVAVFDEIHVVFRSTRGDFCGLSLLSLGAPRTSLRCAHFREPSARPAGRFRGARLSPPSPSARDYRRRQLNLGAEMPSARLFGLYEKRWGLGARD